jgi:hypothetical protein
MGDGQVAHLGSLLLAIVFSTDWSDNSFGSVRQELQRMFHQKCCKAVSEKHEILAAGILIAKDGENTLCVYV